MTSPLTKQNPPTPPQSLMASRMSSQSSDLFSGNQRFTVNRPADADADEDEEDVHGTESTSPDAKKEKQKNWSNPERLCAFVSGNLASLAKQQQKQLSLAHLANLEYAKTAAQMHLKGDWVVTSNHYEAMDSVNKRCFLSSPGFISDMVFERYKKEVSGVVNKVFPFYAKILKNGLIPSGRDEAWVIATVTHKYFNRFCRGKPFGKYENEPLPVPKGFDDAYINIFSIHGPYGAKPVDHGDCPQDLFVHSDSPIESVCSTQKKGIGYFIVT